MPEKYRARIVAVVSRWLDRRRAKAALIRTGAKLRDEATVYSVADAAKVLSRDPGIQIGRDRLFTVMNKLGWTYRAGDGRWRIKQTAVETGRLSELPSSHYHPRTGELVLDPPQVRVTVKGVHDLRRALGAKALEAAR